MTEHRVKVRDIPPTAVRIAPDLRHALARAAAINGRTLHGEIVYRLQQSFAEEQAPTFMGVQEEAFASYAAAAGQLPDAERRLVTIFRKLSPEKQLALLNLLA